MGSEELFVEPKADDRQSAKNEERDTVSYEVRGSSGSQEGRDD